jgi:hypothetical protein
LLRFANLSILEDWFLVNWKRLTNVNL